MKLTNEVIHEESPGQRWLRLRHDFRQRNQQRINSQLVIETSPLVRTRGAHALRYAIPVLPEIHDMTGCEDATPFSVDLERLIPPDLADELGRRMAEAASHVLAEFSDNVGLLVEDVDGPPIYNLDDEQEIFRAIDRMLGAGDAPAD